jgi:hypothetical protein
LNADTQQIIHLLEGITKELIIVAVASVVLMLRFTFFEPKR